MDINKVVGQKVITEDGTLTIMKLDDELKECFDMECNSVGLTQYPKD